jgi:hypothetical protein
LYVRVVPNLNSCACEPSSGWPCEFGSILYAKDRIKKGDGGGEAAADFITFDAEDRDARASALSKSFGGLNVEASGADDEDLLALMGKQGGKNFDD